MIVMLGCVSSPCETVLPVDQDFLGILWALHFASATSRSASARVDVLRWADLLEAEAAKVMHLGWKKNQVESPKTIEIRKLNIPAPTSKALGGSPYKIGGEWSASNETFAFFTPEQGFPTIA